MIDTRAPVTTSCWEWTGGRTKAGYGKYRGRYVHRIVAALVLGPIQGRLVCHRCDNPPCFRPDHLFIGTQADNMRDARRKNRTYVHPRREVCLRGHSTVGEDKRAGNRGCRECERIRNRERWGDERREYQRQYRQRNSGRWSANGGAAKQRAYRARRKAEQGRGDG